MNEFLSLAFNPDLKQWCIMELVVLWCALIYWFCPYENAKFYIKQIVVANLHIYGIAGWIRVLTTLLVFCNVNIFVVFMPRAVRVETQLHLTNFAWLWWGIEALELLRNNRSRRSRWLLVIIIPIWFIIGITWVIHQLWIRNNKIILRWKAIVIQDEGMSRSCWKDLWCWLSWSIIIVNVSWIVRFGDFIIENHSYFEK